MKTIRETILETLEARGKNRAWLANLAAERGVCDAQTVYRYLRGDRGTRTEIAEGLMRLLDIHLSYMHGRRRVLVTLPAPAAG